MTPQTPDPSSPRNPAESAPRDGDPSRPTASTETHPAQAPSVTATTAEGHPAADPPSAVNPSAAAAPGTDPSAHFADDAAHRLMDQRIEQVELAVSRILRWGVTLSILLLLAGTVIGYLRTDYGHTPADLKQLIQGTDPTPKTLAGMARGLLHLDSGMLIILGLLTLILTPVSRVVVSIIAYQIQRDRAFVLITSVVLLLLITSFIMGYFTKIVPG